MFDTCDVVHNWSIFLLPSIVLDNLFDLFCYKPTTNYYSNVYTKNKT